ncbi:MAG: hypothetical protein P1S60_05000 [Anaerolineae bacterium]|nr:hypothetical protein [Anaerolineae bacterium]
MAEAIQRTSDTERDKLSVLLAIILSSATLFRFVELPNLSWDVQSVLGSPLGFDFSGETLVTLLIVGLVSTGTLSILREHPLRETQERPLLFSLITPAIGSLLVSLLLIRATSWILWLISLFIGGGAIGILVHLSYQAFSAESGAYPTARTLLNIIDYLAGFALFSMLLREQERALVTGPAVLILSGLLAGELLSSSGAKINHVLLYVGIIAFIEAELAWVIGYWPVSSWPAATVLSLGLYVWSGIGYQYLLQRLTGRIIIEFVAMSIIVLALVIWIQP